MFSCQPASRDESSEGLIFATESVPGVSFNFFNGQMLHFARSYVQQHLRILPILSSESEERFTFGS